MPARTTPFEIDPLTDWLWCLRTPMVQAYAVRQSGGFNLVDTGTTGSAPAILAALAAIDGIAVDDVRVHEILLTHGHDDHAGSADALVRRTGARLLGPAVDEPYISRVRLAPPPRLLEWEVELYRQARADVPPAPPATLDVLLHPGDTLAWERPVTIVGAPGHTPGSVAAHFARDRVLLAGDAIAAHRGAPIVGVFNVDTDEAARSFARLARLDVDIAAFGHGDPLRTDARARLAAVADRLATADA
jgi:glyoxylase-like metal-dependent hydrolase (beta-lactamase superfamily II)